MDVAFEDARSCYILNNMLHLWQILLPNIWCFINSYIIVVNINRHKLSVIGQCHCQVPNYIMSLYCSAMDTFIGRHIIQRWDEVYILLDLLHYVFVVVYAIG